MENVLVTVVRNYSGSQKSFFNWLRNISSLLALDQRSEIKRIVALSLPLQLRLPAELPRRENFLLFTFVRREPSALLLLDFDADLLLGLRLTARRCRSRWCAVRIVTVFRLATKHKNFSSTTLASTLKNIFFTSFPMVHAIISIHFIVVGGNYQTSSAARKNFSPSTRIPRKWEIKSFSSAIL